mgnify:CR=1 FL=1
MVADELSRKDIKPGPMAHAVAEANGDEQLAKSLYIKFRADQLFEEMGKELREKAEIEEYHQKRQARKREAQKVRERQKEKAGERKRRRWHRKEYREDLETRNWIKESPLRMAVILVIFLVVCVLIVGYLASKAPV